MGFTMPNEMITILNFVSFSMILAGIANGVSIFTRCLLVGKERTVNDHVILQKHMNSVATSQWFIVAGIGVRFVTSHDFALIKTILG